MDIQDAIGKSRDELRRKQAHVAGQAHQVHPMRAQAGSHISIVFDAGTPLGDKQLPSAIRVRELL